MDDIRKTALAHLDRLTARGREIAHRLKTMPDSAVDIRAWQQDCATAVNELSGGSKAHWLSRAFSQAFLVRPAEDGVGGVVTEASAADIVDRLLAVLAQASASLATMDPIDAATLGQAQGRPEGSRGANVAATAAPPPRRFDFVHTAALRPVLEQAYVDSGHALEAGDYHRALMTSCSILEAIITDSLESSAKALAERPDPDATFDARIAAAESAGLIRGGCARLPAVARTYRDLAPDAAISERDAKVARQVLHVILRDLDPGR